MNNNEVASAQYQVTPEPAATFNDSLYNLQWYYAGSTNININEAWDYYRGNGVIVAVIDDGFDYNHADLSANYDQSIDVDLRSGDNDAFYGSGDRHGTAVSGVIAADDNGVGTVGIAPDSTLMGLRVGFGASGTISQFNNAFNAVIDTADVVNNSWGYTTSFSDNFNSAYFSTSAAALKTLADDGRDGLGVITVFAAGNDKEIGHSANYHNHSNSPYTITVGAIQSNGQFSEFSSSGASVLISAPGSLIATTDNTGADGYVSSDYAYAYGTSFSAPLISGVVALMLEANANLGWRDVQDILAYSAVQTGNTINDGTAETYSYTGADNWNGGGLHFSNQYGYGLVDVTAAVKLAESWEAQSTSINQAQVTGTNNTDVVITDLGTVSSGITITDNIQIEHAQIAINLSHGKLGQLDVFLIAPDGTRSQLIDNPDNGGNTLTSLNFTLTSEAFRGMDALGNWRLEVVDTASGQTGTLNGWSLTLSGKSETQNDQYVFTDEYSKIASQPGRTHIVENDGGTDIINAAAVSSDSFIDLSSGYRIDGVYLGASDFSAIENVTVGWGNDVVYGNAANNVLNGNRGDDYLNGRDGDDILIGSLGNDSLDGGAGNDTLYGGDGNDNIVDLIGDTIVDGGAGDDYIYTDDGDDIITAGAGNDIVTSGLGNDTIHGNDGDDILDGGDGDDIMYGDDGDDSLYGRAGVNALYGGAGADILVSEDGDDIIEGGSGDDYVFAGAGNDDIKGDAGQDLIYGDGGNDTIHGGDDDDRISGGDGEDTIYGDAGDDYIHAGAGNDTVYGGGGNDSLVAVTGDDIIYGEAGDDILSGGSGINTLYGGADNDQLYGYEGNDILDGGDGNDNIFGGSDNDTIRGGLGNDLVLGEAGDDTIHGDDGNDELYGGSGNDTVYGDAGDDKLDGGLGNDTLIDFLGANNFYGEGGNDTITFTSTGNNLHGGAGADQFILSFLIDASEAFSGNYSTALDFSLSDGDVFDISNVLSGFDALSDSINDFVTIGEDAGRSTISARNDTNDAFSSILFADNDPFAGLSVQDLLDSGTLVV